MKKRRSPAQVAATRRMLAANSARRRGGRTKAKRGGCGCGSKAKTAPGGRPRTKRIILKPGQVVRVPVARRY